MKGCIKVLKDQPPNSVEGLLNALRCVYRCAHADRKRHVRPCSRVQRVRGCDGEARARRGELCPLAAWSLS